MIKNLTTGQVAFRVAGYSRRSGIRSPVVRLGFGVFGRWTQQRFYRNIQRRMYRPPGAGGAVRSGKVVSELAAR